jgi:hypothetical protein
MVKRKSPVSRSRNEPWLGTCAGRRRILHGDVTHHPTADCVVQHLCKAQPLSTDGFAVVDLSKSPS